VVLVCFTGSTLAGLVGAWWWCDEVEDTDTPELDAAAECAAECVDEYALRLPKPAARFGRRTGAVHAEEATSLESSDDAR
jgi:hypothetical protein